MKRPDSSSKQNEGDYVHRNDLRTVPCLTLRRNILMDSFILRTQNDAGFNGDFF